MRKKNVLHLVLILGLFFGYTLYAAEAEKAHLIPHLRLQDVLELARGLNPDAKIAEQEAKVAEGFLYSARALPNPVIDYELEITEDKDWNAGLSEKIELWGTRGLRQDAALARYLSQEASRRDQWLNVARAAKSLYFNVVASQRAIKLAQENAKIANSILARNTERYQSGRISKAEWLRTSLSASQAQNEVFIREKELHVSKANLNVFLNRSSEIEFEVIDETDHLHNQIQSFTELSETAAKNRPEIEAIQKAMDATDAEISLGYRSLIPTPNLGFFGGQEDRGSLLGFRVSFDIPLLYWNRGEIIQARARKKIEEIRFTYLLRKIEEEVHTAFLEVQLAKKQVGLYKKSIKEADQLLRQATLQYNEGKTSLVAFLDYLKTYRETQFSYYRALYDYHLRIADLERAIGKDFGFRE